MLKFILKKQSMDWIHLAQDRGKVAGSCERCEIVHSASKRLGIKNVYEVLLASQEGFCFVEVVNCKDPEKHCAKGEFS
jgi:hypothetical protein